MIKLRGRFSAGKVEEIAFKYVGFVIKQPESKTILDHSENFEKLKNETLDSKKASDKKKNN